MCWLLATFKFVKHLSPARFVCQAHTYMYSVHTYTCIHTHIHTYVYKNAVGTKRGENECKHTRLQLQHSKGAKNNGARRMENGKMRRRLG